MKTGNPADFKGSGCKRPKAGRGTARTRSGRSPRAPRSSAQPFGGSHHHRRRTAKAAVPGACSEPPVSGHPCPPILFLGPEVAAMNRAFPFLSVPSGGSAPSVPAVFPCLLSLPDRLSHLLRAGPPTTLGLRRPRHAGYILTLFAVRATWTASSGQRPHPRSRPSLVVTQRLPFAEDAARRLRAWSLPCCSRSSARPLPWFPFRKTLNRCGQPSPACAWEGGREKDRREAATPGGRLGRAVWGVEGRGLWAPHVLPQVL